MKLSQLELAENKIQTPLTDIRLIKIRKIPDHETHVYKDFIIDGKSMFKSIAHSVPGAPELSTMLRNGFVKKEKQKYIDMLLGQEPGDCAQGRIALYVCPIDGDIQCGAVACRVTIDDEVVRWSDFVWVNGEDDDVLEEDDRVVYLTDYTFDRSEYEALLSDAAKSI